MPRNTSTITFTRIYWKFWIYLYNTNLIVYTLLWTHTISSMVPQTRLFRIYLLHKHTTICYTILTLICFLFSASCCCCFFHLIQQFSPVFPHFLFPTFLPKFANTDYSFFTKKCWNYYSNFKTITNTCPFDLLCHDFIQHIFSILVVFIFVGTHRLFLYWYTRQESRESTIFAKILFTPNLTSRFFKLLFFCYFFTTKTHQFTA